jgi:hypothetical protein
MPDDVVAEEACFEAAKIYSVSFPRGQVHSKGAIFGR